MIARGGMASVYLASQIGLGRSVAVKVLSPPPDADDEASFEERFRLEASTLAGLDHRNIVIVHDFGETHDGRYFIAMEYVNGPRLTDMLRPGPLDPDRAVGLMLQVCAAVRYAHRRGVVHRDLKPSNLLIRLRDDGEEQVKVVDFGLVKLAEHEQTLTRAGLILGSPHCMAPEQIRGLDVDHRADIYAIGVVLFRALTGNYPFHGDNSTATMIAHLNEAIPSFADRGGSPELPALLEEVVLRCLAKEPEDRYDSVQELMEDLARTTGIPLEGLRFSSQTHSTITRQGTALVPSEPLDSLATHPGDRPRRFLMLAALIGAALLLALVVSIIALVVVLSNTNTPPPPPVTTTVPETAPAPMPAIEPTTDPERDPTPTPAPEPANVAAPEPVTPEPVVRPAPPPARVAPAPVPVAPTPAPVVAPTPRPSPAPAAVTPPEPAVEPDISPDTEATPAGYFGLPEDL